MTKEEWKKISDWWGIGYGSINMEIDGHKISLYNNIDKKKMIVEVIIYVDGYIRGRYYEKDSELGNRFWRRVKKPLYSTKKLKELVKIFGKRSEMSRQRYYERNVPSWRSFASFKKHITSHNTDIKFIPESEDNE